MQLENLPEDEVESLKQDHDKFFKEAQKALLAIVAASALIFILIALGSCNCYFTMVHTQGQATDVVDDSGTVSPDVSPTIPITPPLMSSGLT